MKYLITNADDFGGREDIDRSVYDSHKDGILSSASLLINSATENTIDLINKSPNLGVGLHLNIVTGEPSSERFIEKYNNFILSDSVSNRGSGNYGKKSKSEIFDHLKTYESEVVFLEFEQQLNIFRQKVGKLPDHIDTHYNSSFLDNIFEAYAKLAQKYNIGARHPVFYDAKNATETRELGLDQDKLDKLRSLGVKVTNYFSLEYFSLEFFDIGDTYIDRIKAEVDKVSEGQSIEISFHPGYNEGWRKKYTEILLDPRMKKLLHEIDTELITYAQLTNN